MILQFELGCLRADRKNVRGGVSLLELSNNLRMNRLRLGRNVFGDQFFALGEDLAERASVKARSRFFE